MPLTKILSDGVGTGVLGFTKTSATSISGVATATISSVPSGTSEIIVFCNQVQRNSTSGNGMICRLGDSGGLETSGYVHNPVYSSGGSFYENSADDKTGLTLTFYNSVSNSVIHCWNTSGNKWMMKSHTFSHSGTKYWTTAMCEKELSATLDRVGIVDSAGTNFSGGTFQLWYK